MVRLLAGPEGEEAVSNAIAGISGGRTSGKMGLELPPDVVRCFMNTGKENSKTLDFLCRLEDDMGQEIHRIEFRAPPRGERPGLLRAERVTHSTMSRKGEPFMDLLLCLKSYREKHKGLGPVAPWARQRMCTAYLKIKTQRAYCLNTLGWSPGYTQYVGLRFDEPDRVDAMRRRNATKDNVEIAPLYDAGVTKKDVLRFWSAKTYDLDLPEHLGNCTGCFLKDEGDLALALEDPETDAEWWIAIERDFAPMRRKTTSYAQVLAEAPARNRIRTALECGEELMPGESGISGRRHHLVTRQEKRRMAEGGTPFSCSCEQAEFFTDEQLLASSP